MKIALISTGLFLAFFLNMQLAHSAGFNHNSCKLKKGEVLNIACTKDCGRFNRWGIKRYARMLGYKVKIHNIYNSEQSYNIDHIDGVLIPGGVDIDPKYYINAVEPSLQKRIKQLDYLVDYTKEGIWRDEFEYGFLQSYFANKKYANTPILGICRGMQMLGVSQGIPLYIDIKKELGIKNRRYTLDRVRVQSKNTELYKIMKRKSFRGVELHHQGPRVEYFFKHQKERWPNINMSSLSNGGKIAESLEWTDRPVLGVQFHPEYTLGKVRRRIFSWLLKQACHNKKSRK